MPTSLPPRARKSPSVFLVFLVALSAAFFIVEVLDPAPVDVEAALLAAP